MAGRVSPLGDFLRLAAWYTAGVGSVAIGPWVALLLVERGWTEAGASAILLLFPIGRMVASPAWGMAADRLGAAAILRAIAALGALFAGLLLAVDGPYATVAMLAAWSFVRTPAFPIVDAAAVASLGPRYGAARAFGSAAFLVVGVVNGLTEGATAVTAMAALSAATLAATFTLPPLPPPPGARALDLSFARDPGLRALFAVTTLHGASLAIYDHLFALHVDKSGLPGWVQSEAIACGVGAEIAMMVLAPRLLRLASHRTWFLVAVATGVPRFLLTATVRDPALLGGLQILHGLHFGAFWIAATALFAEAAPPQWRNTAQALLPASGFGLGPILGLLGSSALLASGQGTAALFGIAALSSALALATAFVWLPAPSAGASGYSAGE